MTQLNLQAQKRSGREIGGICQRCRHDLLAGRDGRIYCSNPACPHHTTPHPTGKALNR